MSDFPSGVVLVVGGSGGLGAACARALARRGADVALTFRTGADRAEAAAEACRALGVRASTHALDLGDEGAAAALVTALEAARGRVVGWVHAAGSRLDQPRVADLSPDALRAVLDADVTGFASLVRPVVAALKRGGGGAITFVSSAGLDRHPPGDVLSTAPKAAIEALLRGLAREEGRFGVRANSVAVGVADGGMFHDLVARGELDPAWVDAARRNVALRRFARPDEVAEVVAFLTSDLASYVTGQRVGVDGGYAL